MTARDDFTRDQLKELAKELGIKVPRTATRARILELLDQHAAAESAEPDPVDNAVVETSEYEAPAFVTLRLPIGPSRQGNDVRLIQAAVALTGIHLQVDGVYGWQTEQAVRRFQDENALEPTGNIDEATLVALLHGVPAPTSE